jgi:hypothetical protein
VPPDMPEHDLTLCKSLEGRLRVRAHP